MEASTWMRTDLINWAEDYRRYPEGNWEPWRVLGRSKDQTKYNWMQLSSSIWESEINGKPRWQWGSKGNASLCQGRAE